MSLEKQRPITPIPRQHTDTATTHLLTATTRGETTMSEDTAVESTEETRNAALQAMGDMDTGLEDFGTEDMVMPRIGIEHTEGALVDNLTGKKYEELEVVMLGLIKQRILWDTEVNDGDMPLCKSFNFQEGHPDGDKFPFKQAGFDKDAAGETLPCASCQLKEWGSHPKNDTPWCSEQHTFPLLMKVGDEFAAPAIFTLQRSGIKPSKAYLTAFKRAQKPLFTAVTKISLDINKRGSVTYSVPKFQQVADTEEADWREFAAHYTQIREFVTTPPAKGADAPTDTPDNTHGDDDDDVPF